jgi:hypothetical protein
LATQTGCVSYDESNELLSITSLQSTVQSLNGQSDWNHKSNFVLMLQVILFYMKQCCDEVHVASSDGMMRE